MRTFSVSNRMGAIAVIAAAAIALAACGGGGGLNEDEAAGLRAELQAAEAAAAAALVAQKAAEDQAAADKTARQAAEAAAAAARTARETAEAEAAAALRAQETAEAAQEAAERAQEAAEAAQMAAEGERDAKIAEAAEAARIAKEEADRAAQAARDLAAAQNAKEAAETARDAAQAAQKTAEDERDAAEAALATAQRQLTAAQRAEQAAQQAQQQAQQQQEQLQQQVSEAQQAELNARATQYIAAINDGGGATPRAGVTISYTRGDTLRINPGGNFETGSGAPAISGFTPRTYTREVGVIGDQTLYHYTNIQAPGTRAFWKIYGLEVDAAQDDTDPGQDPTPTGTARVVRVGATLNYGDAATYDVAVSGTYHGVSGTYTCAACEITESTGDTELTAADFDANDWVTLSNNERTFVTGTWDFKPGSISSGVRQNQDTEYLYFGIWVEEPDLASSAHDYEYFRGGSPRFEDVTNTSLPGTARFRGGAVGKYVTRDQVGDNARIGTFTATANFTATFGGSPTLEGRLTDFRNASGPLTGWSVYLGATGNVPATFTSGALTDQLASATIGGVPATGTWDATLHGTPNPGRAQLALEPDAATKYPLARYPVADLAGVVGNFFATSNTDAAIATAAIAGAFAATPQ